MSGANRCERTKGTKPLASWVCSFYGIRDWEGAQVIYNTNLIKPSHHTSLLCIGIFNAKGWDFTFCFFNLMLNENLWLKNQINANIHCHSSCSLMSTPFQALKSNCYQISLTWITFICREDKKIISDVCPSLIPI